MPAGTVAPGIAPQYATQPDAQPVSFSDAPVGSHQSAPAKEHAAAGAPNGEEFTSCLDAGGDAWIGERLVEELNESWVKGQDLRRKADVRNVTEGDERSRQEQQKAQGAFRKEHDKRKRKVVDAIAEFSAFTGQSVSAGLIKHDGTVLNVSIEAKEDGSPPDFVRWTRGVYVVSRAIQAIQADNAARQAPAIPSPAVGALALNKMCRQHDQNPRPRQIQRCGSL